MNDALFFTALGEQVPAVRWAQLQAFRDELFQDYRISRIQLVESAAYSLAMVARHSLGSYAQDGMVTAILGSTLAGQVGAAALRHLHSAGAQVRVFILNSDAKSEELSLLLSQLTQFGITVESLSDKDGRPNLISALDQSHNILFANHPTTPDESGLIEFVCSQLNETATPVHCVEIPPGIDPDTGATFGYEIFASSTLSLGVPLTGLLLANDHVGRHYLCETLFPRKMYAKMQNAYWQVFSSQPVVQIFPSNPLESSVKP